MNIIYWLLIGLAAGAIAKLISPQEETGGWVSSIGIGIVGSLVGGFIANILPFTGWLEGNLVGKLIIATGGSVLVLFIYYKYFADKWKLKL